MAILFPLHQCNDVANVPASDSFCGKCRSPDKREAYFKRVVLLSPGLHRPTSSTGPDEYITEPSRPHVDFGEYEQSGDLPFTDDEDFPYYRTDGSAHSRGPGGQDVDVPDLVLTEEAKSCAWGRHGVPGLLVFAVMCCVDAVW